MSMHQNIEIIIPNTHQANKAIRYVAGSSEQKKEKEIEDGRFRFISLFVFSVSNALNRINFNYLNAVGGFRIFSVIYVAAFLLLLVL